MLFTSGLLNEVFHVLHINYWVKDDEDSYVPAEIAVTRFNLKDGVGDSFHHILKGSCQLVARR